MWSDNDLAEAMLLGQHAAPADIDVRPLPSESLRAIMTRAVELMAARDGTMTPNLLSQVMGSVAAGSSDHKTAAQVGQHLVALGARAAVLEAENAKCLRLASEACAKSERLEKAHRATMSSLRPLISQLTALSVEMAKVAGEPAHANCCEHCGHDAPAGQRFCSTACQQCESTDWPADGCARICATRYPCSPTCTHDDAATPGHAERVKGRSEAVLSAITKCPKCGGDIEEGYGHASGTAQPSPYLYCLKSCGWRHTVKGEVVWNPTREQEAWFDSGAEAMRTACLEAALEVWESSKGVISRNDLKAAIEGAVP